VPPGAFPDVRRGPDAVRAFGPDGEIGLHRTADGLWSATGVVVGTVTDPGPAPDGVEDAGRLAVRVTASTPLTRLALRWRGGFDPAARYLGDHWERGYGDLEWRPESAERVLPWSVLVAEPGRTVGYGVRVGAGALCFWTADRNGVTLWADVRNGGRPVELAGRNLAVAEVVGQVGAPGRTPFAVQRALSAAMCPSPRLPDHPVYGTNDWHVHYGRNGFEVISRASEQISALAADPGNRPYSVIDDGWSRGGLGTGPWYGNDRFGDMGAMAAHLRDLGVRPGIWYRPLTTWPGVPDGWRLERGGALDPSRPEVLALVAEQVARLVGWGYELIKHDFTCWDVLGRWGPAMGAQVTDDGWGFADRSRTTAEVLLELYRAIRAAAGPALLIGCNTIGHLAAGQVELQRIGDDTSGVSWNRTRRMGVNALAFRAAQHGTLFAVDADVAPITPSLPWPLARQWLKLVAGSGTPLFVSVHPEVTDPEVLAAVRSALATAAVPRPVAEPLDWADTRCPTRWRLDGAERAFAWNEPDGGWPFGD
jgi:alpha-galactosidase